jgi:glycosyltransferase involved in cell wall biosynthesis
MLTLITATLNASRYIEQAFASIRNPHAVHHIVVDGGSTDKTIEICERFPWIETVVVPGCSIYDAWNIGIERARGEWLMLLNADDELAESAVDVVAAAFADHPEAEIIAGRAVVISRDVPEKPARVLIAAPGGRLDAKQLALGVPAINAMAFRRRVFDRHGLFDPTYRVAGDRAFLLKLALRLPLTIVISVDAVLYRYYAHQGSLTLSSGLNQRLRIARDHLLLTGHLLAEQPSGDTARLLRYWRRREAAVATMRCAAAGQPAAALGFAAQFFGRSRPKSDESTDAVSGG